MPISTDHTNSAQTFGFSVPDLGRGDFERFRELILRETGISLPTAKRELLRTRLTKRLKHLKIKTFAEYYDFVSRGDGAGVELVEFINCVTTNKTDFFREPHHFSFLMDTVFPEVLAAARRTGEKKLRIWSAACSTGQEPYTIAMTIRDGMPVKSWDVKILASDIDSNCLKTASQGIYDEARIAGIPSTTAKKHFLRGTGKTQGKVAVRRELREMIKFRRINFADNTWPIHTKFDVIFCRNAMIYFDRDFQQRLLEKFLKYLHPQGYLILGHSENVTWMGDLKSIGQTIYRPRAFFESGGVPIETDAAPVANSSTTVPQAINSEAKPSEASAATPQPKKKRKAIIAGEYYSSGKPICISTLLGSCIAACLYDPEAKVGGMNHFVLPEGHGENSGDACFGINAMELLINSMMALGADRNRLVAKLYGGAQVLSKQIKNSQVGAKNAVFVKEFLTLEGIPILEEKLGGKNALKVVLSADTGEVVATALNPAESKNVIRKTEVNRPKPPVTKKKEEEQITFF